MKNRITTDAFTDPDAEQAYRAGWPDDPDLADQHFQGDQCGGCSFFAPFNGDYGLCCDTESRHHLETVFEHFTCPGFVGEGWGPHSFSTDLEDHCRCGGGYLVDAVASVLAAIDREDPGPDEESIRYRLASFLLRGRRLAELSPYLREEARENNEASENLREFVESFK